MIHRRQSAQTAAAPYIPDAGMKIQKKGGQNMKNSTYKSYDELPLFLNAETTAKLLGISISGM